MKWYVKMAGIFAAGMIFSSAVMAAGTARLEVKAHPESPAARVWIDQKPLETTPLPLPYFPSGTHVIRVSRMGAAIERRLYLKEGTEVILVADFLKNELQVENRKQLNYEPLQGKTRVLLSPSQFEPAPPAPSSLVTPEPSHYTEPEPKPASDPPPPATPVVAVEEPSTPEPKKPEQGVVFPNLAVPSTPEPSTPEPEPPAPSIEKDPETNDEHGSTSLASTTETPEDGGWSAIPKEGEYGPPVPPEIRARLEEAKKKELEAAAADGSTQNPDANTQASDTSTPEPELEHVGSCPPKPGADLCKEYDTGIKGTVHNYYCLLVNKRFRKAYEMRVTNRDLDWFVKVSKSFCNIHDFHIRSFSIDKSSDLEATTSYVVDLIDSKERLLESWQMKTFLAKHENVWRIRSTFGKKTFP